MLRFLFHFETAISLASSPSFRDVDSLNSGSFVANGLFSPLLGCTPGSSQGHIVQWLALGCLVPPYKLLGLAALLPSSSVRLSPYEAIAILFTISSSSINSPVTHARLACSLPYTWAKATVCTKYAMHMLSIYIHL
jgi:hypothetical protein